MRPSSRAPSEAGDALRVILTADPGQQYRFASVELPGLDAAGPDAAKLRDAFAVKAGDPVIAADVIAGGARAHPGARRGGFRRGEARRAGHRGQSPDPPRDPDRCRSIPGRSPGSARSTSAAGRRSAPITSAIIARFKRGDPFQRSKLDDLRRALIATTLVANADIQVVPVQGGRVVDLDVRLEPAPSAHDCRRARLRHRAGRAGRSRPGPTAISSIRKAR